MDKKELAGVVARIAGLQREPDDLRHRQADLLAGNGAADDRWISATDAEKTADRMSLYGALAHLETDFSLEEWQAWRAEMKAGYTAKALAQ